MIVDEVFLTKDRALQAQWLKEANTVMLILITTKETNYTPDEQDDTIFQSPNRKLLVYFGQNMATD